MFIISDVSLGYTTLSWDSYINYKSVHHLIADCHSEWATISNFHFTVECHFNLVTYYCLSLKCRL